MTKDSTNETPEQWRPIAGFEDFYEVSSLGRVRSLGITVIANGHKVAETPGKILKPSLHHEGYYRVNLAIPLSTRKQVIVRHLVAEAFLGPRPKGHWVMHLDGNQANCKLANLAYLSPSEGAALVHGRRDVDQRQAFCGRGHELADWNVYMYGSGRGRLCASCSNTHVHMRRKPDETRTFQEVSDQKFAQRKAKHS